ncbi:nSTAND1 domain-containing NTPase [Saccharothrix sp. Mg75]|uniref:nSTAND1 domain-containing NTPase n=1 Tax=Saccharothrix sp. Mg75 TaxID=3445357 RepID=UPI003EEB1390
MPRVEQPLSPDGSALTQFAVDLRLLRVRAGSPSYRKLGRVAHYSATTLSEAAGGRKLPSLEVTLAFVRACGGEEEEWERRWHSVAAELNARPALPVESPDVADVAPYPGLRAFTPDEADLFAGRERLVSQTLERLRGQRVVVVFGASGSGKSSLLRAGVLPALDGRPVLVLTPGPHPVEQASAALAPLLGVPAGQVAREWAQDRRGLHRLLLQAAARDGDAEVVVVVDQFEEVFTLCADPAERDVFVGGLITAASAANSVCRVVLGLRSDFFAHCAAHPSLLEALPGGQVVVGPMSTDELRRAIVHPAKRRDCAVEGALLAELVAQAHGRPAVLPLLSHVLRQTWARRSGHLLTLAGFRSVGGLDGAVARTAEDVHGSLSPARQAAARALFGRLVALGEGTEDTRRRLDVAEVEHDPDLVAVLTAFTSARLLVRDGGTAEMAHEALIRSWPRLRAWLDDDREDIRLRGRLAEAARTWSGLGRDPGALLRGVQLDAAVAWRERGGLPSALEQEFLDAGVTADRAARAGQLRRARQLQRLTAVLTAVTLVLAGTTTWALRAQQTARERETYAKALTDAAMASALAPDDPAGAARLGVRAYLGAQTLETRAGLFTAYTALTAFHLGRGALTALEEQGGVFQTGKILSSSLVLHVDADDRRRLWDTSTTPFTGLGHLDAEVRTGSLSGDGRLLVTADEDGRTRLWDLTDLKAPHEVGVLPRPLSPIGLDHSGRFLLTRGLELGTPLSAAVLPEWRETDRITLWDLTDPARPVSTDLPAARYAVFSPTDPVVLVEEVRPVGSTTRLLDLGGDGSLRERVAFPHFHTGVPPVFSQDGGFLALHDDAGDHASVYRVADGREVARVPGLSQVTNRIALSGDGSVLAVQHDREVTFWDLTGLHAAATSTLDLFSADRVRDLSFTTDSRRAVVLTDGRYRYFHVFDTDAERVVGELCARPELAKVTGCA